MIGNLLIGIQSCLFLFYSEFLQLNSADNRYSKYMTHKIKMQRKMEIPKAQKIYKLRSKTVELPFLIKANNYNKIIILKKRKKVELQKITLK